MQSGVKLSKIHNCLYLLQAALALLHGSYLVCIYVVCVCVAPHLSAANVCSLNVMVLWDLLCEFIKQSEMYSVVKTPNDKRGRGLVCGAAHSLRLSMVQCVCRKSLIACARSYYNLLCSTGSLSQLGSVCAAVY